MVLSRPVKTLRLFYSVARHRSFSQAAAEQGITQSAASQRISQLEQRLGVQLLDRSVRPLTLTAAGEVFLRGARDLIERYDRLAQQVVSLQPQLDGKVVVNAIYSAGIGLLRQIKDMFQSQHPGVSVHLDFNHPEEVYEAVRQQRCDLGIVSYPSGLRDVSVIPLRDEPMAVVCAPDHALAQRQKISAARLGRYRMVTFESNLPVGRHIRRYLRSHHVSTDIITNVFDNIDTLKSAVAVTDQISILPRRTVMREVAAGTLAVVELEPELVRPLGVIHHRQGRSGQNLRPAAQAFLDFLLKHAGPDVDFVARYESQQGQQLVGGKV